MAKRSEASRGDERVWRPRVFRISEIPVSWTSEKLHTALKANEIEVLSDIRLVPSVWTSTQFTAVVTLDPAASLLLKIKQNPMAECLLRFEDTNLVIDQHFYGLTALSSPPTDIKADIIAVHGLSGHAFGSWAYFDEANKTYINWLKDFLGEDVLCVRVIVYGYEARLDKTTTMSRLLDYRRSFIGQLISSRKGIEKRPLILFGHSFGGTIIGQTLESAKSEQEKPAMLNLLRSVAAIFFFAVPHRGFRTAEIVQMAKERSGESKTKILADIEKDSETLRRLLELLGSLCIDIQIVSVYEEMQTPSVVKDDRGFWVEAGAPTSLVDETSAVLNLPGEIRIPATADHKKIVKYSHRDQLYHQIKNNLNDIVQNCISTIAQRYATDISRIQRGKSLDCSELQPFAIAFVHSGASRWADTFLALHQEIVAQYEVSEHTDPGFILFQLQCWKFIAWSETMRAAWTSASVSGSLLEIPDAQLRLTAFDISTPLLRLTKHAVSLIQEIKEFKDRNGSFEIGHEVTGPSERVEVDSPFGRINKGLGECLNGLKSFMTDERRKTLAAETYARALANTYDRTAMQMLERASSEISDIHGLAKGMRIKRELQHIKQQESSKGTEMLKPLHSLQQSALRSRKTVLITTYQEGNGHKMERVLVEWSSLDRRWSSSEVQLARTRISNLAKELSIQDKPVSLRILQTLGVVEDFKYSLNKRFGMLYRLPMNCSVSSRPVALNSLFPDESREPLFSDPLLSERFALARALANALYELHASGWLHKEISSHTILFFPSNDANSLTITDPYIIGFGYARPDTANAISLVRSSGDHEFYRHPDLRIDEQDTGRQRCSRFRRKYDIYSLGLVLLEIGIWDSICIFKQDSQDPQQFTNRLLRVCKRDLGHRMGRIYRDVVIRCIEGIQEEEDDINHPEEESRKSDELMNFYWSVLSELSKCQCK